MKKLYSLSFIRLVKLYSSNLKKSGQLQVEIGKHGQTSISKTIYLWCIDCSQIRRFGNADININETHGRA